MSSTGPAGTEHSVTVRLGDLELTITARRVPAAGPSSDDGGFELVSASAAEVTEGPESTPPPEAFAGEVTFALQERALAAVTIHQLENFGAPFLSFFSDRLRPIHPTWTPRARIARAFRAGVAAQRRLSGVFCESASLALPLRNSIYICLRGGDNPEPFWTTSYTLYIGRVRGARSDFHRDSVSHAFPSKAEGEAYLVGACQPWPSHRAAVEDLYLRSSASDTLPLVHFHVVPLTEEGATIGLCHVVMVRENGFMLAIAASDELRNAILAFPLASDGSGPELHGASVTVETNRRRPLGKGAVDLVDLPWESAGQFTSSNSLRGYTGTRPRLIQIAVGANAGRPERASTLEAAAQWVNLMDPVTAQEYLTGEELAQEEAEAAEAETGDEQNLEMQTLRTRIAELEAQLVARPSSSAAAGRFTAPTPKAPPLFQTPGDGLTETDWTRLRAMAGPPPQRVGQSTQLRGRSQRGAPTLVDNLHAEIEKEVLEPEEPEVATGAWDLMQAQLEDVQDPIHRFMMMQLQQNQVLLDRLVSAQPKEKDPVLSALSGGGSDSASVGASTGVKGCMARDAYLKAVQDLPKVAAYSRVNALKELGIPAAKEDSSLMRKYVERKMALADHRVLAQFGTMLAESWALAYESNNEQMMGALSRMLYLVEQASLDNGRGQLAYLLSGFPEPAYHLFVSSKKRGSILPFAGLVNATWVSGNLAYLKDLDYMESRMSAVTKQTKVSDPDVEKPAAKPKKPPFKKGKGEGKGKPAAGAATAESEA